MTAGDHRSERAAFFVLAEHGWADDASSASLPPAMLEEARRRGGGGRKLLAHGEGGFHSTYSTMPPGYAMVPHRHDHDELMVIVAGGATFGDGGRLVGPGDSVVVPAGVVHSFVCGAEGMQLVTVARGPARTELVTEI
jgi:mannose-6-phosphate isomerase-like protein (cupin superfamily)